jgi:Xaa-Pro aminopeptidase
MSDLQQTLRDLHRELADIPQLGPEQRALLEAALADIQRALAHKKPGEAGNVPDVASADALEGAAVRLETNHPGLAGAVRAFVDALTKAGI